MKLLLIGGSDAGISAGLIAKELAPHTQVDMLLLDEFPNYSICGIPFFLSGEVPDVHNLAHRTAKDIEDAGIHVHVNHTAVAIHPDRHEVIAVTPDGKERVFSYDRLVIGTGAVPIKPALPGIDYPGVFLVHSMDDSLAIHQFLQTHRPEHAVIVGAGYIGLEMADALRHRQMGVTLVEKGLSVHPTIDRDWGHHLGQYLVEQGINLHVDTEITAIQQDGARLIVKGTAKFHTSTDMVIVVVGVKPNTALAQQTGIRTGMFNAIEVNPYMETNLPDIYAAGDCVLTHHQLLKRLTYLPLGTTAHKQGRIAGAHAVGHAIPFKGSLGTQVVKVFDWAVARTGLSDAEAQTAGYSPLSVTLKNWDHKIYYPGATPLWVRMTGDRHTGALLGTQIMGHWQGEVAKRIDIIATALYQQLSVADLMDLDLSYTPPLSSPWDPVQMAAHSWISAHRPSGS